VKFINTITLAILITERFEHVSHRLSFYLPGIVSTVWVVAGTLRRFGEVSPTPSRRQTRDW